MYTCRQLTLATRRSVTPHCRAAHVVICFLWSQCPIECPCFFPLTICGICQKPPLGLPKNNPCCKITYICKPLELALAKPCVPSVLQLTSPSPPSAAVHCCCRCRCCRHRCRSLSAGEGMRSERGRSHAFVSCIATQVPRPPPVQASMPDVLCHFVLQVRLQDDWLRPQVLPLHVRVLPVVLPHAGLRQGELHRG